MDRRVTDRRVTPRVDVRCAADRMHTGIGWLDSRHSFSFGHHYDPDNTHFGLLLVSNDDVVSAGTGFETHPHRDMEIVTWVLDGSLVHQDSQGNSGVLYRGLAQRMSAGTGILHSEKNDAWRLGGERNHLFVPRGSVDLEGTGPLGTGDAARITGAQGERIVAGPDGAEVLVWQMAARLTT